MITYAVAATGAFHRLPCRPIDTADHAGRTWWHCSCRPGTKVADPTRVLHAGERAADRLAAEMKETKTMTTAMPDVRVGQVWADNDKRSAGRHVRVMEIVGRKAAVQRCDARGNLLGSETRIRLDRFRPTSSGYRLVREADGTEVTP